MTAPSIQNVFFPSDFSAESQAAFAHALKIALATKSNLDILHVDPRQGVDWTAFPGVRELLERWRLLPEGSPRHAVTQLGINVRKVTVQDLDPVLGCVNYLQRHPIDLVVVATHAYQGRMSWLHRSIAEPIARKCGEMTLFIRHGISGFVNCDDGTTSLSRILIPVALEPDAKPALRAAEYFVEALGVPKGTATLLHVGPPSVSPRIELPRNNNWQWNALTQSGPVVGTILEKAAEIGADLIVMATEGRHGFLDALRGTTTERVLHGSPCPVLAVPIGAPRA